VWFPRQKRWIPSAGAVGLSWTFHWYYSLLFFLGAVLAWYFAKRSPEKAEELTFPVASGVIAGGSLVGVVLVFWDNGPALFRQFFGG
jgi:uncharacterized oligopeptide transporter (OPT) family protein